MHALAVIFILLFFTVACAGSGPKTPQTLTFSAGEIQKIALAPILFAATPMDRRLGVETADRIQAHAQQILREKGYDVRLLEAPHALQVPTVERGADLAGLAPAIPPGVEGVIVIRVDHFFETGLQDRVLRIPFEVHASAALVAPGKEVLWRDEGVGRGSRLHSHLDALEVLQVSAQLVESLFRTLPATSR